MALDDYRPFSFTHVLYREGDLMGYFLAGTALAPVFLVVAYVTLIVSRRDLTTVCIFMGQLVNEVLNYVLKQYFRAPRPTAFHIYAPKYGMPSNHSQFMGFWAMILTLWMFRCWSHPGRVWKAAGALTVQVGAILVMYSRVYLQYHTVSQVAIGYFIGVGTAVVWFQIVQGIMRPRFAAIADWKLCKYFLVRDTTSVGDVMQLEYDATMKARKSA